MLRKLLLSIVVLSFPFARSVAEAPSGTLTLAHALARTLERSPELAAYSWDTRAAEARIIQAHLRPNPEVSITSEDMTGSGDFRGGSQAQRTLQLSQLVELGGKRPARIAEAQAGKMVITFDYQVRRVEVLRQTTEIFIDALVAQRQLALAEETVQLYENAVPLSQKRVEVGKASDVEVVRSNVAVSLAQIERERARRDLLTAKARLAAQWGEIKIVPFDRVAGDLDATKGMPAFDTLVTRLARNPQLARWTAERGRREATLRLQQTQAVPDITGFAGPRVAGKAENVSTGVVGFSMPLPLFNRNQGNIAEARALLSKVGPEERAAEVRVFAELSVAYQTLNRAAEEDLILREKVLPGATQSVDLLTAGYEAGRFGQLEILDARRTLFAAREQHLRSLADYHKALAAVEALTAAPIELSTLTNSPKPVSQPHRKTLPRK